MLVCGATRHDAEDLVQHALEKGPPSAAPRCLAPCTTDVSEIARRKPSPYLPPR
jgi:hypothetical protein